MNSYASTLAAHVGKWRGKPHQCGAFPALLEDIAMAYQPRHSVHVKIIAIERLAQFLKNSFLHIYYVLHLFLISLFRVYFSHIYFLQKLVKTATNEQMRWNQKLLYPKAATSIFKPHMLHNLPPVKQQSSHSYRTHYFKICNVVGDTRFPTS